MSGSFRAMHSNILIDFDYSGTGGAGGDGRKDLQLRYYNNPGHFLLPAKLLFDSSGYKFMADTFILKA